MCRADGCASWHVQPCSPRWKESGGSQHAITSTKTYDLINRLGESAYTGSWNQYIPIQQYINVYVFNMPARARNVNLRKSIEHK